jgi:hypothetical protein
MSSVYRMKAVFWVQTIFYTDPDPAFQFDIATSEPSRFYCILLLYRYLVFRNLNLIFFASVFTRGQSALPVLALLLVSIIRTGIFQEM